MQAEVTLIADPRVVAIPICESHEPLVDLRDLHGVAIDERKRDVDDLWLHARAGVARRLQEVQTSCPPGIRLLLVEAYRPLDVQRRYFEEYVAQLAREHPSWDAAVLRAQASRYVAPPDIDPPHSTGGAVDVTLVDAEDRELDLGTRLNASPEESSGACFMAAHVGREAKRNRELLARLMTAHGFVNYGTEWWHWSCGDRYWAFMTARPFARYGSTEPRPIGSVVRRLWALGASAVGVATEVFGQGEWPNLVARAAAWSGAAVELSALTDAELAGAVAFLLRSRPAFAHLSLHAPLALPDAGEAALLAKLNAAQTRVAAVIQHPHVLADPAALSPLGERLVLENMDAHKESGRVVAELEPYFRALPEAGFCLDVAHVKTIDPSMRLAHDLLDAFGRRLRELHLSGIRDNGAHVPLDHDAVTSYAPVLRRCRDVPWILETLPIA
jgi:zinc D-Ala-D-Ala dipeptidase